MIKLTGEKVTTAWEDYKNFMAGLGVKQSPGLEQAFKMGFAMGQAAGVEKEQQEEPKQLELLPRITINGQHNQLRADGSEIRRRTEKERESDAALVKSILQRKGKEMNLQEILTAVNAAGANWYTKSASGHMKKAMEKDPQIKKVGYGVYTYGV